MNEYTIAGLYFLFSLLGVVFSFKFAKKYSGPNFKKRYFLIGLVFNLFMGMFHVGVGRVGYNPFIPITEEWLKGNDLVGWVALFFVIPQLIKVPNNNYLSSGYKRDGNK